MMNAQAILDKIESDAKAAVQKVHTDAETKAKTMTLEARQSREMMEKTMLAQAEQECAQMEERMRRIAALDDRKGMLSLKRDLIGEAFAKARETFLSTKPANRRAFYLRQIVHCAGGEETLIVGADKADWFDDGFPSDANKALQAAGKPGKLMLSRERRNGCAGVVLSFRGAEMSVTFDSLLNEAQTGLEQAAAQALFSE